MDYLKNILLILCLFSSVHVFAQKQVHVSSPDGKIIFHLELTDSVPVYDVKFDNSSIIIPSGLSLSFEKGDDFGERLKMKKPIFRKGEEQYTLVVGKTKNVHDQYREVTIPLQEKNKRKRTINIIVRVFNDGLAFRYEIPEQPNWKSFNLTAEHTSFRLAGNPKVLTGYLENYTTAHETRHELKPFSQIEPDTLMDMPALIEFSKGVYMAITEAELVDYAGMYLVRQAGALWSSLSPLPGQNKIKVKADLPHHSPWRVLLISDQIGKLIESNIITSLNAPCKIKDVSWIKPGKSDFHWWNGDITPDTTFAPGVNFKTNKYYIDFCAKNNIDYHTIIGYGGFAWYQSDASSYGIIGSHTDATKPVSSLNIQRVCDYASKKGVGIRVWVHWKAIYPHLEKVFTQFQDWGIQGMMVDFLNRDDQEMVNIQTKILKIAAKHHLHIQFHGAYKPTGLYRTYPNEFTREGTMNYENDKWGNIITAEDDISIPFTRGLAGPTDYHLGGFRAVPKEEYKTQYTRPLVVSTRCHMLAMYVVLESYLQMVCDYPKAYIGEPGFEFIRKVPTTWDETHVPSAGVNKWITIARRKGRDWYVGTINNGTEREIEIPLHFLSPGNYIAEIYADDQDVEKNPNHLIKRTMIVDASDVLPTHLAASGGEVIILKHQ